jgi:hypothetical protein
MDLREFMQTARDLIARLAPHLDQQQAEFIRQDAHAGEWDLAIDNLLATLKKHQVPITPADKADLHSLLSYMTWPDTRLDGLTIIDPSQAPPADTPADHPSATPDPPGTTP